MSKVAVYPNDLIGFPQVLYGKVKAWNGRYGYAIWYFNGVCFKQDMMFHTINLVDPIAATTALDASYHGLIISFTVGAPHNDENSGWINDKPTAHFVNLLDHASEYKPDDLARMLLNQHEFDSAPNPTSVSSAIPPMAKPTPYPTPKPKITAPSASIWNGGRDPNASPNNWCNMHVL